MSSTPTAAKETLIQEVEAEVKKVGLWLTPAHIVLLVFLAAATYGCLYLYSSKQVDAARARATIAEEVAKVTQKAAADSAIANAAEQKRNVEAQAAYAAVNAQYAAANAQLIQANAQLTTALAAKQQAIAQLPPAGQAQEWQKLIPQAQVAATPAGFTVNAVGGVATIQALEELSADRQQIANDEKQIANDEKQIANDVAALTSEKAAHAADVANDAKALTAAKAETQKVSDDYDLYKKKAHRNYLRAFGLGFITGVVTGHLLGI